MIKKYFKLGENQDGAVAIIVALSLTVFLGIAVLAIDVGVMGVSKNELQNAADAAALAGASQLARQDYENSVNPVPIKQAAIKAAGLNTSSKNSIVLSDDDIVIGTWDWDTSSFSNTPLNAVKVTISNHNTKLFFSFDRGMGASAVAIVGPISGVQGRLIPIAVNEPQAQQMEEAGVGTIYEFGRSAGNWGTVDFDEPGGGTPEIGDWLENGYQGNIEVNDEIYTETGVGKIVGGQNKAKVQALIGDILIIPVIDEFGNGMSKATVVNFIAIKITGLSGKGANTSIEAEYVDKAFIGGNVDMGIQNFGVVGVKLAK